MTEPDAIAFWPRRMTARGATLALDPGAPDPLATFEAWLLPASEIVFQTTV